MSRPLKLAYFSPLPPAPSGIADYSQQLLPALATQFDITMFVDDPTAVSSPLTQQFPTYPISDYPARRWQTDLPLYHMGNSLHHAAIYDTLIQYPGLVVLHDYGLHHFVAGHTTGRSDFVRFWREMVYNEGVAGARTTWAIAREEARQEPFSTPLNGRVRDASLALLVHSDYVRDLLRQHPTCPPVYRVPFIDQLAGQTITPLPRPAAWPPEAFILACAGEVTANKQLPLILQTVAQLRQTQPQLYLLLIGAVHEEVALPALLDQFNLHEAVISLGRVASETDFSCWMATADVIINLRQPTLGETSATAVRALALGKPLIVFDHGWYAELPDAACVKIPVGDGPALAQAITTLHHNQNQRQAIATAAQTYIQTHCQPEQVAEGYTTAVGQLFAK